MALTASEIAQYHESGYVIPEFRLDAARTDALRATLDRSDLENGCLKVIPGSHKDKVLLDHMTEDREDLVLSQRTADDAFDPSTEVALELEPGQMSLHDVYMIHGAGANESPRRRAGVALRYMPATSVFERNLNPADGNSGIPVAFATRPLWLVKGKDQTGRNDFAVGH